MYKAVVESLGCEYKEWAAEGLRVQFAKHTAVACRVDRHTDSDCSYQIGLSMGSFANATLCCETDGGVVRMPCLHGRVLKFEGRRHHSVDFSGYNGVRYSAIAFKSFDSRMSADDPLCHAPSILYESGRTPADAPRPPRLAQRGMLEYCRREE